MGMKSFVAASVLMAATVGMAGGTAYAAPVPEPEPPAGSTLRTDILPGIHYTASIVDNSVVLRTDGGSLTTRGTQFQVLDGEGRLVAGMPLTYLRDGREWPIAARVDGNTATFTPSTNPADTRSATMLQPVDIENVGDVDPNTALGMVGTQFGLATAVGTLLGSLVGGALGCVAGAVIGAPLVVPTFFAGPVGLCIAGAATGITLGAAAGMILIGVPVGIASAIQFYNSVYGQ